MSATCTIGCSCSRGDICFSAAMPGKRAVRWLVAWSSLPATRTRRAVGQKGEEGVTTLTGSDQHDAMGARVQRGELPRIVTLVARGNGVEADAIAPTGSGRDEP